MRSGKSGLCRDSRGRLQSDIPTIDEASPGVYFDVVRPVVPKGTPKEAIRTTGATMGRLRTQPPTVWDLGQVIPPREQPGASARRIHKTEIEKWWPIIKSGNVKLMRTVKCSLPAAE